MTTQVIAYNVQKALRYREMIASFLIATIVMSAAAYVFFVQKAITNVVARQNISKQIGIVNAQVNDLESKYLVLDNSISMEVAAKHGFVPADVTAFISTKSLGQAHTSTNNEL
ncbi:MAG: hypothetical protein WCQ60_01255 [bacterium]